METKQARIAEEADKFALAMFNYVFPKRFDKQKIPGRFNETADQQSKAYFTKRIGAAILQICYMYRDSFYNRFLRDYPDYLADKLTLFRYCKRCALELYDEKNIINSLLMFSSMLTEMVSYCLMMSVEKGAIFINSVDEYWSSIFVSQFASAFYAFGGWKTLQDESLEKASMYEETKRKYPTRSNEYGPFHYWISDVKPEKADAFPLENGYFRIRDRISQINKFDVILSHLFQGIVHPNAEVQHEAEGIVHPNAEVQHEAEGIVHPNAEVQHEADTTAADLFDPFLKLSLHENEDLKNEVLKSPDAIPKQDPQSMDVDDSSKAKEISEETDLIQKFKSKTFFATSSLDGIYFEQLFASAENTRILINDRHYFGLMKYTVNSSETPDAEELVKEARRIISEATSGALRNPSLQNQPTDICSESSKHFEKHEHNLEKTYKKDYLLHAGKVKVTAKLESQQEEHPYIPHPLSIDSESSEEEYGPKATERKSITQVGVKMAVEAYPITSKTVSEIDECIKSFLDAVEAKYITQVLQQLNSEFDTTFPVDDAREFYDIIFPSTKQGTDMMLELMNISHTLMDRIQDMFEGLPAPLPDQLETNFKEIILGRTGLRIAISTLERSRSTQSDSQCYCTYLIRVLICECAYFLRMKEKLNEVKERSARDGTGAIPRKSRVRRFPKKIAEPSTIIEVPRKCSSETDNRKRGKHQIKKLDASPSKQEMVDKQFSSGLADADDSSNSPVCSSKRLRLPSSESVPPVQMSSSHYREENVKDSSESE